MIKDIGSKPAASTHSLGTTIPLPDNLGFETYLALVNPIGYGVEPNNESTLRALEDTKKAIITIKPLAAGILSPQSRCLNLSISMQTP